MRASLKHTDSIAEFRADLLVVPVFADKKLGSLGRALDRALGKTLNRVLGNGDFNAKTGETLLIPAVQGTAARHVMLWGLGDKAKLTRQYWVNACAQLSG
ncbi:MAG: hypothetical protein HKO71_01075, partial [Pseudomonadales bacterium]|nr:hypothetical protein [Pseudomonadales bacterium]